MVPASILAAAAAAMSPMPAGAGFPTKADLKEALNELEKCHRPDGAECGPPDRRYQIHRAKCVTIPPEEGRPSVTCRVDLTLVYPDPSRTRRHRDSCLRFGRLEGSGPGPDWTVLQIRDRPCEMPTALKRDPNRVPRRPELEEALVGAYTCFDLDGITDCGPQPKSATVEAFRCRPIAPGEKQKARAACRVTASVNYSLRFLKPTLQDKCVHLERLTAADESPASWIIDQAPDKRRCGIR